MKYVVFNEEGALAARLIKGLHIIPEEAVEVDDSLWLRITQEVDGVWMRDSNGHIHKSPMPELVPPVYTNDQIEAMRLRAYADPLTGSDRFFAEAQRMDAMGEPGWQEAQESGVRRFNEIQQQFPWAASADSPNA